jgi:hypothetical protein
MGQKKSATTSLDSTALTEWSSNKGRRDRHGPPIELREIRINDVIVAVSEVTTRQAPPQNPAAIDVFFDRIPGRELRRRVDPTRVPLLVNQESSTRSPLKGLW